MSLPSSVVSSYRQSWAKLVVLGPLGGLQLRAWPATSSHLPRTRRVSSACLLFFHSDVPLPLMRPNGSVRSSPALVYGLLVAAAVAMSSTLIVILPPAAV